LVKIKKYDNRKRKEAVNAKINKSIFKSWDASHNYSCSMGDRGIS